MSNQPANILVLSNQPDEISNLKDMLKTAGVNNIELHSVSQHDDALDCIKQYPFDVFIVDINVIPDQVAGLFNSVRSIPADIPIILLTSFENFYRIDPVSKENAEDCLVMDDLRGDIFTRSIVCAIEKRRFQKSLLATEASLQKLVEQIVDGILIVGEDEIIQHANIFAETMFGCPKDGLIGLPFQYPLISNGKMLIEIPVTESKSLSVEMYVVPTEWKYKPAHMVILRDITEQQKAQERLKLSALVFETTAEGIFITDENSNIISANQAFTDITGYTLPEILGKNALEFHSDQRDSEFFRQTWNSIAITGRWQGEMWNRRKDGDAYPEWVTISTVKDDRGELSNYIAIFTDISLRKESERRLLRLATHDPLTDLPNRELFYDRLEQALMRARRNRAGDSSRWMVAVMLLDLDGFKAINDTLGHAQGDSLLQIIAQRLLNSVRMSDSVARFGGDEFTVIIENLTDVKNPSLVAEKILKSIAAPFILADEEHSITASLGISVYPFDGEDSINLLKHADIAMYRAKEKHNTYEYYSLTQ